MGFLSEESIAFFNEFYGNQMSNKPMAQTALETFWEQIAEILPFSLDSETAIKLYEKYQECKQIEKEQLEDAWVDYYTQTYGNNQNEDLTFKKKSQ